MINLKYMNKKNLILGILAFLALVIFTDNPVKNTIGSRTSSSGGYSSSSISITEDQTATTSPSYFVAGTTASSTLEIETEYDQKLAIDVCLTASSTATVLQWTLDFSDTDVVSALDWFEKRDYTETSALLRTWGATEVINTWTPANASASTTCIQIYEPEDLLSVKTKITYNVIGDNGAVYLRALTK